MTRCPMMLAAGISLAAAIVAGAADAPAPSADKPPAAPSVQGGGGLAACRAWTDGCVTCRRSAGAIACNNIGTACQPQPPRCLEALPAEEKKPEN